jgi:hypothetical protein
MVDTSLTGKLSCDGPAFHPGGVILLVTYCYKNWDKLQPEEPSRQTWDGMNVHSYPSKYELLLLDNAL